MKLYLILTIHYQDSEVLGDHCYEMGRGGHQYIGKMKEVFFTMMRENRVRFTHRSPCWVVPKQHFKI